MCAAPRGGSPEASRRHEKCLFDLRAAAVCLGELWSLLQPHTVPARLLLVRHRWFLAQYPALGIHFANDIHSGQIYASRYRCAAMALQLRMRMPPPATVRVVLLVIRRNPQVRAAAPLRIPDLAQPHGHNANRCHDAVHARDPGAIPQDRHV